MNEELEEKLKSVLKDIAKNKDGLVFLAWLLDITSVFSATYFENQNTAYFVEGKKSVGMTILNKLQEAKVFSAIIKEKEING